MIVPPYIFEIRLGDYIESGVTLIDIIRNRLARGAGYVTHSRDQSHL